MAKEFLYKTSGKVDSFRAKMEQTLCNHPAYKAQLQKNKYELFNRRSDLVAGCCWHFRGNTDSKSVNISDRKPAFPRWAHVNEV